MVMKVIAVFLIEKQAWHCEFSKKETDDGLRVVHEQRAPDDDMGEAKDLTKEAPQVGSGPYNLLIDKSIELSAVIHVFWTTEGPLGRTMRDMFGMTKHRIEVKYYQQFPHGLTWSSNRVATSVERVCCKVHTGEAWFLKIYWKCRTSRY